MVYTGKLDVKEAMELTVGHNEWSGLRMINKVEGISWN